jgi:hypothetical protein
MRKVQVVTMVACLALASCGGGGGSNDQGVSFRALGVFQEVQEQVAPAADTLPSPDNAPGDSGRGISLAATLTVPNDLNNDGDLDGGFLGARNDLAQQNVNITGVQVEIFIPGAILGNPVLTDFVPMAVSLGPAEVDEGEQATNLAFVQTLYVQPDVMAFLNQNQTLLPPTPFTMNVVMTLEAISDSGDSFDSNEFTYTVSVLP